LQDEHNDTLGLLAAHLCFQQDLLPQLFASLGAGSDQDGTDGGSAAGSTAGEAESTALALAAAVQQPTLAQAELLELLCTEAHDMPQAQQAATSGSDSSTGAEHPRGASMRFLSSLAQRLAAASKGSSSGSGSSGLSPGQQQVLQAALHLMRDICARDDSGAGLAGGPGGPNLVRELQVAGALPALLAMLKALDPIQSPHQQRQQQQQAGQAGVATATANGSAPGGSSGGTPAQGGIQLAELAPQLAEQAACFPSKQPYPGFRSDLLAALANAAHGRPAVQVSKQPGGALGCVVFCLSTRKQGTGWHGSQRRGLLDGQRTVLGGAGAGSALTI